MVQVLIQAFASERDVHRLYNYDFKENGKLILLSGPLVMKCSVW